jgi:hypothetical protein
MVSGNAAASFNAGMTTDNERGGANETGAATGNPRTVPGMAADFNPNAAEGTARCSVNSNQ